VGVNRWQKVILTWWPNGIKKKRKIRIEVGKGSGNSDEKIQTREEAKQANLGKRD
jgi:hypothetical protein